jgi:hypothetical protein
LAPLQSFTSTSPQRADASRWHPTFAPSEVSSPSAFLNREEPHIPAGSQTDGYVAPSGILTLSTPCSPRDLLGLFHPRSALGVLPSRLSSFHGAVRPLGRRAPQGLPSPQQTERIPTRTLTPQKAQRQAWVLARLLTCMPPWAFSASRPLVQARWQATKKQQLPSPLVLF